MNKSTGQVTSLKMNIYFHGFEGFVQVFFYLPFRNHQWLSKLQSLSLICMKFEWSYLQICDFKSFVSGMRHAKVFFGHSFFVCCIFFFQWYLKIIFCLSQKQVAWAGLLHNISMKPYIETCKNILSSNEWHDNWYSRFFLQLSDVIFLLQEYTRLHRFESRF